MLSGRLGISGVELAECRECTCAFLPFEGMTVDTQSPVLETPQWWGISNFSVEVS